MSKFEEMQAKLATLITTMQAHIDNNELDEAEKTKSEIVDLKDKMEKQSFLDALEISKQEIPQAKNEGASASKESASFIRACIKKFSGKPITEIEDALLLPTGTGSNPDGTYNEGYILPQDIQTLIRKRICEYRSLRTVCGSITTTALTGSYPVENLSSLAGLVDFTDGTDGTETVDFKFDKISFSLKEKGALIQLSNTLLALTDNDLMSYIVEIFAKKAVITENSMAVTALLKGKTVKTLADWRALKSSINKDLDPAALYGTVIVTNQDGFDMLDSALDENGRPVLQPDVTSPTSRRFMGYRVEVFSNAMLPSTVPTSTKDGYAPIYYGNISEGVKFVNLNLMSFATSKEAGFLRNTTYARLIEFLDVIQHDGSDKCYIAGQIKVANKTGA